MMFILTYLEMTRALAEAERVYRACDDDAKEIVSDPLLRESLIIVNELSPRHTDAFLPSQLNSEGIASAITTLAVGNIPQRQQLVWRRETHGHRSVVRLLKDGFAA